MDEKSLRDSLSSYETQLEQVETALEDAEEGTDKDNLRSLRNDISHLIELTKESLSRLQSDNDLSDNSNNENSNIDDEFALFMAEMKKDGVVTEKTGEETQGPSIDKELKSLEGMKCRAPHTHQWGDIVYHNAMICSVATLDYQDFNDIQVRVLFINPTHQEMLPCPYYLETDCKFSDEDCRFSHGEKVAFSSLQEYTEPKFELLKTGSNVLAKHQNKLWQRATIKKMYDEKCLIKFDSNQKDIEVELHDVLPLENGDDDCDDSDLEIIDKEDIINLSLVNTPSTEMLGDWEKYTKGIGSKLMQKMGYVVGTGLGRNADGRLDPVTAVILPAGKSLDHCMQLRENAGGDQNLFSVERKLKRLQKKQEAQSQKLYEQEKRKVDVFNFLNNTLSVTKNNEKLVESRNEHRKHIKSETSRNLNICALKIEEDIKRTERELYKIRESLTRHTDTRTQMHINLTHKLHVKQEELKDLRVKSQDIKSERSVREDKKKLTVF